MSDYSKSDGPEQPVRLIPSASSRLANLNLDYLQLLMLEHVCADSAGEQSPGFNGEWVAELARAPHSRLQDIAGCSFSLFTASLHNAHLWRQVVAEGNREAALRYAAPRSCSREQSRSAFLECLLFYAWHLAQVDRISARSMLGLSDQVAEILLNFELWQLHRAAVDHPQILIPRWAANAYFWPDLIEYARSGQRQYLDGMRLLGTQLLAQELEPSSIEHLTGLRQRVYKRPIGKGGS